MTTTFAAFQPSRSDGRSDRQVILDLALDSEPDTMFTYDTLVEELSKGLDDDVKVLRSRVYRAVREANKTLLRERKRYLSVVKEKGYRVIFAHEHTGLAIRAKESAEARLRRGYALVKGTRLEELTEAQRNMAEGQMLMFAGILQAHDEHERRLSAIESAIRSMPHGQKALDEGA